MLFLMNYGWWSNYIDSGEKYVLKFIKKREWEVIIFDVGANIWWYSNVCIEIFNDHLQSLHCFEPSKDTYTKLVDSLPKKSNIILNKGLD